MRLQKEALKGQGNRQGHATHLSEAELVCVITARWHSSLLALPSLSLLIGNSGPKLQSYTYTLSYPEHPLVSSVTESLERSDSGSQC